MQAEIEDIYQREAFFDRDREIFAEFKKALNRGEIRAAEPDAACKSG